MQRFPPLSLRRLPASLVLGSLLLLAGCAAGEGVREVLGVGPGGGDSEEAAAAREAHARRGSRGLLPPRAAGDDEPAPTRNGRSLRELLAAGDFAAAEALLEAALADREETLAPGDSEGVRLLVLLAEVRERAGRREEAELTLTRALVLAAPYAAADQLGAQRGARLHMGRVYEGLGDLERAETSYNEALALCEEAPERESDAACNIERGELAGLREAQGRWDDAEPLRMARLAAVQRGSGPHDIRLAVAMGETAAFYERQGKYNLAEPLFARSADVWETAALDAYELWRSRRAAGEDDPLAGIATPIPGRAVFTMPPQAQRETTMLRRLGREDEAAAIEANLAARWRADTVTVTLAPKVGMSAEGDAAILGTADAVGYARNLQTAGWIAAERGDPGAASLLERAERMYASAWNRADARDRRRAAGERVTLGLLRGELARRSGDLAGATTILDTAATLAAAELPDTDIRRYEPVVARAAVRREAGLTAEAESILLGYGDAIVAARGSGHPDEAWGLRNLAWVYDALGDRQSAAAADKQAREIWENWVPVSEF